MMIELSALLLHAGVAEPGQMRKVEGLVP